MKRISKINKLWIFILTTLLLSSFAPIGVRGESSTVFRVQTAKALDDNQIEISVYLNGAENVAGIDAAIQFDPQKVSFISSSLGTSLNSSLSDIYYDEETSNIRYIILYAEAVNPDGILFNVVFDLNEGESYQPELIVNELIDGTDEMNDIPFSIAYQHADGNWSDIPDESAAVADTDVVDKVLEEYGASVDKETDSTISQNTATANRENEIIGAVGELQQGEYLEFRYETTEETEMVLEPSEIAAKQESPVGYISVGALVCVLGVAGIVVLVRKKGDR